MCKDSGMIRNPGDRGDGREHKTIEYKADCYKKTKSDPTKREVFAVFAPVVVMERMSVLPSNWQEGPELRINLLEGG